MRPLFSRTILLTPSRRLPHPRDIPTVNLGKSKLGYNVQMRRSYSVVLVAVLYVAILFIGLLLPRNAAAEPVPMGILKRVFHEILFLSGPLEVFLNFLLFAPFFFALLCLLPGLSRFGAALISCLVSGGSEIAQSQIVGRVSSGRDFASNCLGVVLSYAAISVLTKERKVQ